VWQTELS